MICYKIKEGADFCKPDNAGHWIQRIVLLNKQDVVDVMRSDYGIYFKTRQELDQQHQVGGKSFEYPGVFSQILGNAEAVEERNYYQWRHNVQVSFAGFKYFERLTEINRGEIFAALLDSNDEVWIFGFDYGLKPEPYVFQNIEFDTITLRSRVLEDTPALKYLGDTEDFWNNFIDVDPIPLMGDFNNDFNNDFDITT